MWLLTAFNDNPEAILKLGLPAHQLCIAILGNNEIILRSSYLWCIFLQGMDSTDDEPPIEEYPVEDNPSESKRSEVENIQAREKAIRHFLNRRGHVLPAPDREEVYPLETISAKRGKKRNMSFQTGYFSSLSNTKHDVRSLFKTSKIKLKYVRRTAEYI